MKVLLVNKFYGAGAGAEAVLEITERVLQSRGHEVAIYATSDPRNETSRWTGYFAAARNYDAGGISRIRDASASVYSIAARRQLGRLLRDFRPDVAHLHNVYHHLTLSVVDELRAHRIPIVMTLHDYKIVCPNYRLLTHDGLCTRCLGGAYRNAVVHRCVKESVLASSLAALEAYLARIRRTYEKIDLFICPSTFLASTIIRAGMNPARVVVVPNAIDLATTESPVELAARSSFVYFGRLAPEKGLCELLDAAAHTDADVGIEIIGDGPLAGLVAEAAQSTASITYHGRQPRSEINDYLQRATAALLPAIWFENCPMSILEASAAGTPTIATRIGGIPELIEHQRTGVLLDDADPVTLAAAMNSLSRDRPAARALGAEARKRAERSHSLGGYADAILSVYDRAASKVGAGPIARSVA